MIKKYYQPQGNYKENEERASDDATGREAGRQRSEEGPRSGQHTWTNHDLCGNIPTANITK